MSHKPQYHGTDLDAARKRAKEIGGVVLISRAPNVRAKVLPEYPHSPGLAGMGYWSDEDGMIRTWERLVASFTKP